MRGRLHSKFHLPDFLVIVSLMTFGSVLPSGVGQCQDLADRLEYAAEFTAVVSGGTVGTTAVGLGISQYSLRPQATGFEGGAPGMNYFRASDPFTRALPLLERKFPGSAIIGRHGMPFPFDAGVVSAVGRDIGELAQQGHDKIIVASCRAGNNAEAIARATRIPRGSQVEVQLTNGVFGSRLKQYPTLYSATFGGEPLPASERLTTLTIRNVNGRQIATVNGKVVGPGLGLGTVSGALSAGGTAVKVGSEVAEVLDVYTYLETIEDPTATGSRLLDAAIISVFTGDATAAVKLHQATKGMERQFNFSKAGDPYRPGQLDTRLDVYPSPRRVESLYPIDLPISP